jgi:hypothetical protein
MADGVLGRTRAIEGQTTLLGRTMHSIEYDSINDEIIVPQQFGQAILTFRGDANGEEPPVRVIQGNQTQLVAPDRLAIDLVHDEIFVPDILKILVFPRHGRGNIAPIRTLTIEDSGPADTLAVDGVNDLLIAGKSSQTTELMFFRRTDRGRSRPIGCIRGPKTGLTTIRNIRVYPEKGWILVAQDGVERADGREDEGNPSFIAIFHISDRGNVAPRWTIGGPNGLLKKPRAVALDPENKTIIVTDKHLNSVLTYSLPELFE